MGQPPAPGQGPDNIKKALAEARELAVRDEAERLAKSREDVPKAKEARLLPFAFIVAVAFGLYALAAQPTWLITPPPPPESPQIVEASLRVAMWQQALHVERYRDEEGRLPVDLGQAGAPTMDGVSYHQVGEPKDKPWYHVLVHGKNISTYVAEQNLEADEISLN